MKRIFGFAGNRGVEKPSTPWKPLGGDTGGDCGNGLNEPMTVETAVSVVMLPVVGGGADEVVCMKSRDQVRGKWKNMKIVWKQSKDILFRGPVSRRKSLGSAWK